MPIPLLLFPSAQGWKTQEKQSKGCWCRPPCLLVPPSLFAPVCPLHPHPVSGRVNLSDSVNLFRCCNHRKYHTARLTLQHK